MTGDELRAHLREVLDAEAIATLAAKYRIQQRERKLDVFELVVALILAGGTHEGGRQYDVLRTYVANGVPARALRGQSSRVRVGGGRLSSRAGKGRVTRGAEPARGLDPEARRRACRRDVIRRRQRWLRGRRASCSRTVSARGGRSVPASS